MLAAEAAHVVRTEPIRSANAVIFQTLLFLSIASELSGNGCQSLAPFLQRIET